MRTKAWGAPTATHSRQQVPARTLGVMASTRGQFRPFSYKTQAVATIFIIFITVSSSAAQDDCYSHINVSEGHELEGISPNLILRVNVEETTPKDTPLYALTVDEDVTMTLPVDENFIKYFSMDKITEKLSIGVKTSLIGVPDYPINTKSIIGTVTFGDFSGGIKDCTVQMSHSILDENTKAPEFTQNTYTLNIREDYPVQLEIYNLEVQASDNDGDSPNNMFTVSVEDCPLEATGEYGGVAGKPYNIKFTLKSPLDFEKTKKYTCTIIAKDKGATSLSSDSATISITVIDMPDEAPVFTSDFYSADVDSSSPSDDALVTVPEPISATDGDKDINSPITYTMKDARSDIPGTNYFSIDEKTGEVRVTRELDQDILVNVWVSFIITAADNSGGKSTTVLEVTLPPVPTTTITTTTISTSEATTCPMCTCPTTEFTSEGTSTPGPTTSECPTTEPVVCTTDATTCEPCTTTDPGVTTSCPPCSTLSTWLSTVQSCPPCPTTTTPDETTTPSSLTTTTNGPLQPSLSFEKVSYAGEIYPEFKSVWQVDVVVKVANKNDVRFSWDEPSTHFAINNNGEITVLDDDLKPDTYNLIAVATVDDPPLKDKAKVNIKVLPSSINVMMTNSLLTAKVEERSSEQALVNVTTSGDTGTVCITDVQPKTAEGKFDIQGKGNDWAVIMKEMLNFDVEHQEIKLKLEAYEDVINCSPIGTTGDELLRNQALVVITVLDINDQKPYFIVPNSDMKVIAYPNDKALQSVVGPVITLQAKDDDTVGVLTYGLVQSNGGFTVEKETGAVYVEGQFDCSSKCDLHVKVTDGKANTEASIKAISVDMTHIYTLTLNDLDVTEVDDYLKTISKESSVQVSKLYVSPIMDTVRSQRARTRRTIRKRDTSEEGRTLQVHVYGIDKDGELMTLDDLNKALSQGHTNVKAQTFSDKEVFQGGGTVITPDTGLKVAVGILGAIVGLAVVAIVGYFAYQRYPRKPEARMTKRASSPIPTLGQAYPNLSYSEEIEGKDESPGSTGHKTNGSVNSTSNGYSHRESPPLFRSNLSSHSSDPHNSISKSEQQQRGLRRVDPGSPEYYGLSSPAPPPSFSTNDNTTTTGSTSTTTTTTTSSPPDTFSTASSSSSTKPPAPNLYPTLETIQEQSPIYAMINKPPKKEPPSIPTTPAKSILKSSGEPSDHMSTTALPPTQPSVPDADYDEIDNVPPASRFSHLKGSPPPRKHSLPIDDDDDEGDDETGTENGQKVTYPGGKKSNLKQEGAEGSDDEKKSVAFKVLVDTKEIVAENPGAAQKAAAVKSNAIEMMMANKKKIEEDEDEDEDERL
ncbi:cadherin-99C-like isoform X2 [Homarus americanus]|uniref:cadherin-99C-like isoform X2 n=1 Tax=Homarus americanus TaxID=6706 RepID=UPI001C43EA97|nr:cadherin-99C-like isoform X2 [Homarus americanus]